MSNNKFDIVYFAQIFMKHSSENIFRRSTQGVCLVLCILYNFCFQPLGIILQILTGIKTHLIVTVNIFGTAFRGKPALESPYLLTPFVERLVVFFKQFRITGELFSVAPAFVVKIEIGFFYRISHSTLFVIIVSLV